MRRALILLVAAALSLAVEAQESLGTYHSQAFKTDYSAELDTRFLAYEGKLRTHQKLRLYLQVHSDDAEKTVWLEFDRDALREFCKLLERQQREFKKWNQRWTSDNGNMISNMESRSSFQILGENNYVNVYFSRFDETLDDQLLGHADRQNVEIGYYYNRTQKSSRLVFRGGKTDDTRRGSSYQLGGWSLVFVQPDEEIPQLVALLKDVLDKNWK